MKDESFETNNLPVHSHSMIRKMLDERFKTNNLPVHSMIRKMRVL